MDRPELGAFFDKAKPPRSEPVEGTLWCDKCGFDVEHGTYYVDKKTLIYECSECKFLNVIEEFVL